MNDKKFIEEYIPQRVGVFKRLDESILPDLAFTVIKAYIDRFPNYSREWVGDLSVIRDFLFQQKGKLNNRQVRLFYDKTLTKQGRKIKNIWVASKFPTIKCLSMIVQVSDMLRLEGAIEPSEELQAVYEDIEFYLLKEQGVVDKDCRIITEEEKELRTEEEKKDFEAVSAIMDSATKQAPKLLIQLQKLKFFPHVNIK